MVQGDRYRPVRRGAIGIFLVALGAAIGPEIAGVGAPGIGGLQGALLLVAGIGILVAGLLGRIDGRYLLVSIVTSGALAFGMAVFTLSEADVGWMLWRLKSQIATTQPLAIHQDDSLVGWKNRPKSHAVDEHYDYRVEYHIGPQGERQNGGSGEDSSRSVAFRQERSGEDRPREESDIGSDVETIPTILCLGGSFTFGQGVEDHETFAARCQEFFNGHIKVVNRGVNGWGTVQVMLEVKRLFDSAEALETGGVKPESKILCYGFLPMHANRNSDRESWLSMVTASGRRKPVVALADTGRWEFAKLVGGGEGRADSVEVDRDETTITLACIRQMDRDCRQRGVHFYCVILGEDRTDTTPAAITGKRVLDFCESQSIAAIDCRDIPHLRFPHDGHPTPQWHRDVAQRLSGHFARFDELTAASLKEP